MHDPLEPVAHEPAEDSKLHTKRVSRRPEGQDLLRDIAILQRTINRLRGNDLIPRGVYRFRTHEEADEWMTRQIASTHARPELEDLLKLGQALKIHPSKVSPILRGMWFRDRLPQPLPRVLALPSGPPLPARRCANVLPSP